ncbi:MAG: Tol-Pal system beta propeller repeat protein TolB [Gammaproteobacteria bacterium]|nr:Tol-Pal system beta propeller repeat protein TolB [Gammaproteobacteria bacterium]
MKQILIAIFLVLGMSPAAQAVLTIEITQGLDGALPIAIMPFDVSGEVEVPEDVAGIVAADLKRSGRFAPLGRDKLPEQTETDFVFWRGMGIDHLVVGKVLPGKAEQYTVQFQLFDVVKGQQVAGYSMAASARHLRKLAHRISDIVFEKLTGTPGAFDTKIAYVTVRSQEKAREYALAIADADGHNEQLVLKSKQPLMSPSWSPDGSRLAYVSFENGKPEIFIQDIRKGSRTKLTAYPGLNNAPVWSPDGKRMAMTLSRDGNAEIYVYHLDSNKLYRITQHYAIDTEPTWAPDASALVFTSDRGGRPQLYRVALDELGNRKGRPRRITYEGSYNSRASFSADGRYLTFVHVRGGGFNIAVMDLQRGDIEVVADTRLGESPSFAPNSAMVIYASETGGRGVLEAVSVDGRARQRLGLQAGDVREPAWSPYLDK